MKIAEKKRLNACRREIKKLEAELPSSSGEASRCSGKRTSRMPQSRMGTHGWMEPRCSPLRRTLGTR